MSQENVEVVRAGYEALNSGDLSAWLATYHSDAELHELPGVPDAAVYRGHPRMRSWAEGIMDTATEFRFDPRRFVEAGEFVLVPVRVSARGRGSGAPVEMSLFHVFEVSEGKVRRVWGYVDEAEALEAVGLSE